MSKKRSEPHDRIIHIRTTGTVVSKLNELRHSLPEQYDSISNLIEYCVFRAHDELKKKQSKLEL